MATSQSDKLRVMVDANVLIAGTGWPRFQYEVLRHAIHNDFRLVLSPYIVEEARTRIAEILPEFLDRFERFLELSQYESIPTPKLEELAANAKLVRDAKDIPVALAAINAHVDYLVSQDKDFTEQDETTEELRKRLKILLPGTFLREHMGWTSESLEAIRKRTWKDLAE